MISGVQIPKRGLVDAGGVCARRRLGTARKRKRRETRNYRDIEMAVFTTARKKAAYFLFPSFFFFFFFFFFSVLLFYSPSEQEREVLSKENEGEPFCINKQFHVAYFQLRRTEEIPRAQSIDRSRIIAASGEM